MLENLTQFIDQSKLPVLNLVDLTQILVLFAAWAAAWIVQFPLRRLLKAMESALPKARWSNTLLIILGRVAFPATLMALDGLSVEVLKRLGQDVGFLELVGRAIVVWLIYRLLTALVDTNLTSEKAYFWSRKVLLPLALIIGVLSALGLLQSILSWGIYLETIGWHLTIGSILPATGIIVGFYFLARWISTILAQSFLSQAGIEPSLVNTVSSVTSYVVITVGVLVAMASIGINISTLTVILGGLSVGLAFGLQEIVNNFVSRFILLIEIPFPQQDIHIRSGVPWPDLTQIEGNR